MDRLSLRVQLKGPNECEQLLLMHLMMWCFLFVDTRYVLSEVKQTDECEMWMYWLSFLILSTVTLISDKMIVNRCSQCSNSYFDSLYYYMYNFLPQMLFLNSNHSTSCQSVNTDSSPLFVAALQISYQHITTTYYYTTTNKQLDVSLWCISVHSINSSDVAMLLLDATWDYSQFKQQSQGNKTLLQPFWPTIKEVCPAWKWKKFTLVSWQAISAMPQCFQTSYTSTLTSAVITLPFGKKNFTTTKNMC